MCNFGYDMVHWRDYSLKKDTNNKGNNGTAKNQRATVYSEAEFEKFDITNIGIHKTRPTFKGMDFQYICEFNQLANKKYF